MGVQIQVWKNQVEMYLHYFGLILCLAVAVNGEPKPKPKPKPDPKAQMAIIMPGGRNFGYGNWYLRNRNLRRQMMDQYHTIPARRRFRDDYPHGSSDYSPPFFPDRRMFG